MPYETYIDLNATDTELLLRLLSICSVSSLLMVSSRLIVSAHQLERLPVAILLALYQQLTLDYRLV